MLALSLPELELELIAILKSQGLPIAEIRLIGLLGKGTRATVFSAVINGVYHVLKVYDSKESLQAELKNLKRITPKDRFLFALREQVEGHKLNIAIIEVPEGRELSSELLSEATTNRLAARLTELHRIRYRQRVSVSNLKEQLLRQREPFFEHIKDLGRNPEPYAMVYDRLEQMIKLQPELFRVKKARIHGDLWWPNVIVAQEDVYLIDWESMRRGDPAEDIAKLRIFIYGYRTKTVPTFFWQTPNQRQRVAGLMQAIINRHAELGQDDSLLQRLRFYLPYYCIHELAQRYLYSASMKTMNYLVADELLNLADNPLIAPPQLEQYGYWEEVESLRYSD